MNRFIDNNIDVLRKLQNQPKALKLLGGGDPTVLMKEAFLAQNGIKTKKSRFNKITTLGSNFLNLGMIGKYNNNNLRISITLMILKFPGEKNRE